MDLEVFPLIVFFAAFFLAGALFGVADFDDLVAPDFLATDFFMIVPFRALRLEGLGFLAELCFAFVAFFLLLFFLLAMRAV